MVWVDVEVEIDVEDAVKQTLRQMDLSEEIEYDYNDIQYHIEDDILAQVMDHVDVDEIAERVGRQESLDDAIQEWINSSCSGVEGAVDELLERGDRFTELERTVERLVEHMGLPEERTPLAQVEELIESKGISLRGMEQYFADRCNELRLSMKKMNKYELIGTAQKMGYHVNEDMTIAQIHEAVGL